MLPAGMSEGDAGALAFDTEINGYGLPVAWIPGKLDVLRRVPDRDGSPVHGVARRVVRRPPFAKTFREEAEGVFDGAVNVNALSDGLRGFVFVSHGQSPYWRILKTRTARPATWNRCGRAVPRGFWD